MAGFGALATGGAAAHSHAEVNSVRAAVFEACRDLSTAIVAMVDRGRRCVAGFMWPAACLLCGRTAAGGIDLCSDCAEDLPRNDPACAVCAAPLASSGGGASVCGECLRDPPAFGSAFVPYRYAYPLDHLVRGLKFRNDLACGRVLGELFARCLPARDSPLPEAIVPVPLAPGRYRERGYNQAIELALAIRRITRVPVVTDVVIRRRETAAQAGLDRKARRKNVRDAFATRGPLPVKSVAILDDVVTTGSTVRELATVLREAGAEQVVVWALARTQGAAAEGGPPDRAGLTDRSGTDTPARCR